MNRYTLPIFFFVNFIGLVCNVPTLADVLPHHAQSISDKTEDLALEQAPITHQTIAELLLTSYGITATEKRENSDANKKTEPSDREKLQKFYTLLTQEPPLYNCTPEKNREMRTFIKNLELFFTQGNEDHSKHFFSAIDRTQTVFGRAALAAMLTQPSSDFTTLKELQDTIRLLVENEPLMNELLAIINQIKEVETAILNNYEPQDAISKALSPDVGRQNVVLLELWTRYIQLVCGLSGLSNIIFFPCLTFYDVIQSLRHSRSITADHAFALLKTLFNMLGGAVLIAAAKDNISNIKRIQTNLIGVRILLDTVQKIKITSHHNPQLNNILIHTIPAKKPNDYKQLLQLLHSNSFTGKASFFSSAGKILAAHNLMEHYKQEFVPFMKVIGKLDALLSLAQLIRESKNKPIGYSFVTYKNQMHPYLNLEDFWNPIVTADHAVPNSITFGATETLSGTTNVILTGANTGGKSTALKAILFSILLAQTCCIAPARNLSLTPFTSICTSLKTVDNTAKGTSQFQAEADRIVDLMFAADDLKDNEFMFIATDELPNGTSGDQAEEVIHSFVKHLASNPRVLSAVATHFPKLLTQLEQETSGLCKNYRMEAYIDENGELIRPFKLEPGISESKIAQVILQKTFERRNAEREQQKTTVSAS